MWFRAYKNYPIDRPLVQEKVEPLKGIIGCEMHEINGWGDHIHLIPPPKQSLIKKIIYSFLNKKRDKPG
jgi:hypothetical protein